MAVLSGLLAIIVALGLAIGLLEGWSVQDSIYFSFVTGLTIGYGDFAPTTPSRRLSQSALVIVIGICGVLVTALVAAIAVKALSASAEGNGKDSV